MEYNLGNRIRFFRQRAGMSQLELEIAIGMSTGAISRIEGNKINPTKETINNIANVLDLKIEEIEYVIGKLALPASEIEILKAKEEAKDILEKRGKLAYLLDDRWRFFAISKTFMKLLKITPEEFNYVIGKTTAQVIVREDSPVLEWIDKSRYEELLRMYLPYYYSQMSYMNDDTIYQETVNDILKNTLAKEIWESLSYEDHKKYTPQENRLINFDVLGKKFTLYYSLLPLNRNSRFFIVEYKTKNIVLDFLPYLI